MLKAKDSQYIKSIHYDNADEFIAAISHKGELYELFNEQFIFRGHSTDEYGLLPSALRDDFAINNEKLSIDSGIDINTLVAISNTELLQILNEYKLLQDFFNTCDDNGLYVPHIESLRNSFYPGIDGGILLLENKWIPKEYWELAAIAQHHRVKTRLLDWTQNLFVALYFASMGVYFDPKRKINPINRYKARLNGEEYLSKHNMEIWALDVDVVMAKPMEVPLHIVRPKYHENNNLCAQKGVFTFWESIYPGMPNKNNNYYIGPMTDRRKLDLQIDTYLREIVSPAKPYLYRITIPQDAAYSIYSFIQKMGYNAATLFPGYYGVARFLKEQKEIQPPRTESINSVEK